MSRQGFDPDHPSPLEDLGGLGVVRGGGDDPRAIDQIDPSGEGDVLPDLKNDRLESGFVVRK